MFVADTELILPAGMTFLGNFPEMVEGFGIILRNAETLEVELAQ